MRVGARIALFLLFLTSSAGAQEVELGTGLICDTRHQVERVVSLMDSNADTAINVVNAEEKDPMACAVVTVAFFRGNEQVTVRNRSGSYQIVKILVVGVVTDNGLQAAKPQAFYTLFAVEEAEA
jgi:hypothetical protein